MEQKISDVKKLFGKRIQELRKSQKMSQEKLAEIIGIEANNLSRIENGKNYPTAENTAKIALALNVSIDELYVFSHHKDYSDIKSELINALEDEALGRMLYKFYYAVQR